MLGEFVWLPWWNGSSPRSPSLWWWLVLFIGPWSSSQILGGKGSHNGQFEGGQLVQVILTKGGLRLPKALVVMLS